MPSSSRTSSSKTWSRKGPEVLSYNTSSSTTSGSYKVPKQPTRAYKPARKEGPSTIRSIQTSRNGSVIQDSQATRSKFSRSSKGSSRRSHTPSHSESSSHSPPSQAPIPVSAPYTCTIRTHHFFNEVRERFTKPSTILSHPTFKLLQQAFGGLPRNQVGTDNEESDRLAYQKVIEKVIAPAAPSDDFAKKTRKKEMAEISQESANQLFNDAMKTVTAEPNEKAEVTRVDYSKYKIVKRAKAAGSN